MSGKKPVRFAGSLIPILAVVALLNMSEARGQTTVVVPASPTPEPVKSGWPGVEKSIPIVYPGQGEVTAENVLVRAGSGLNYYVCGRLTQGSKVVVREQQYGFLKIDPLPDCFSLIAADYVKAAEGSDEGVVTGMNVRVRAGAIDSEQNYAIQCKLDTGDEVHILGTVTYEMAGREQRFYKIQPPAGKAFFWVSDEYVRYIKPYEEPTAAVQEQAAPELPPPAPPAAEPLPKSQDRLEMEAIDEALKIEMRKPIAERGLAEYLAQYLALKTKTQSPDIANLVESRIREIHRQMEIQTALQKSQKIRQDYESSQQRMRELNKELSTAGQAAEGKIVEKTGLLKPSHVFSSRDLERWRLVEPSSGRNICYLLPGKVDAEVLKSKEGKIVSLSGPAVFDLRAHLDLVVVNEIHADNGAAEDK